MLGLQRKPRRVRCIVRFCRNGALTNLGVLNLCDVHLTAAGVPIQAILAVKGGGGPQKVGFGAVDAPQGGDVTP